MNGNFIPDPEKQKACEDIMVMFEQLKSASLQMIPKENQANSAHRMEIERDYRDLEHEEISRHLASVCSGLKHWISRVCGKIKGLVSVS